MEEIDIKVVVRKVTGRLDGRDDGENEVAVCV